jgi:uncharacterized protein (TIGR00369 family)
MTNLQDNDRCYVCGKHNAAGLQASFSIHTEQRSLSGSFMPRPEHEGWQGIIHGGIIAALLDEAMVKLASALGTPAMTAEITVKFRSPAVAGKELHITARIKKDTPRLIEAEAAVSQGEILVGESTGKLMKSRR